MENIQTIEATCESCGKVFQASAKRYYCSHCNQYYYVCSSCADAKAKCRFCGIPLKRRVEPQLIPARRRAVAQQV